MSKKNILFIYPSSYDTRGRLIKSRKAFIPSRTLPYLAALTPNRYECQILDELVEEINFDTNADIIVFTGMLRHIPRAIDIAREFKKRKKITIIGGVGAFAVKDMVKKSGAFDCQIVGEVDDLWPSVLDDLEHGKLKDRYECLHTTQLKSLPHARFDLMNDKKYMRAFWDRKHPIVPIETSRGCPKACEFCLVSRFFGNKMRYRPVEEVVEEIKYQGSKFVMFTDDNIAINPDRARELFLAIKPLKIQWLGQFEASTIEHPELLRLASESGCASALVGIESLVEDNLRSVNKGHNIKFSLKDIMAAFRQADIPLLASLIFGLDYDTPETIEWTIEEMIANDVNAILPWIFTPTPGTLSYDRIKNEGRILHKNYSLYDFWHPVSRPKSMTADQLEEAFWRGLKRYYSLPLIWERLVTSKKDEIPATLYHLYFYWKIRRGLHPLAGNV